MKRVINSLNRQAYETPMVEVVAIENPSMLCASGGGGGGGNEPSQTAIGRGVHFETDNGTW